MFSLFFKFLKEPSTILLILANLAISVWAASSANILLLAAIYWLQTVLSFFFYFLKIPLVSKKNPEVRKDLYLSFAAMLFLFFFLSIFLPFIVLFRISTFSFSTSGTGLLLMLIAPLAFLSIYVLNFFWNFILNKPKDISDFKVSAEDIENFKKSIEFSNWNAKRLNKKPIEFPKDNAKLKQMIQIGKFNGSELPGVVALIIFVFFGIFLFGNFSLVLGFGLAKTAAEVGAEYQVYSR
ncbi:MAG: hypothetical protein Q7R70_03810 [Candidatus Diapherotrites archaeon]|nr:hypothetical protein [Candidatus Diapherotrites archaeon]